MDKIHEKGSRNSPLPEEQKDSNPEKSRLWARVEHVFGFIEKSMGVICYRRGQKGENGPLEVENGHALDSLLHVIEVCFSQFTAFIVID